MAGSTAPNLAKQMVAGRPPINGTQVNGTTNSQIIQIVDDEKNFTNHLSEQIGAWGLRDSAFDYHVVAVFGSQSTGKSTLLNRLFGTGFDVMDESKRQQTTKGIWMCRGRGSNIMVMDVEGVDGREHGEDQDFERKSALFSLASSEILIVNLWEHQVGLYQGANMGLLKTVFEVNLGLFGKKTLDGTSGRTLLLFVIRDHIGQTPLANLRATLVADLLRLWDSIAKPNDLKNSKLDDFFDLAFTTLSHKLLAEKQFETDVLNLRSRFVDKNSDNYLFKPAYHKRIPADGVAFYMENIWEQVQNNKDLDLPTQQELLAQFRCDEISAVALSEFNEQAKSQKRPVESGRVVEGLGALMGAWKTDALARYDRDASRYHKGVYGRKRLDLVTAIHAVLSPLFLGQLKNLHRTCLVSFKQEMLDGLKGQEYDFAELVSQSRTLWQKTFADGAAEAVVEDAGWSWEDEYEDLKKEIGAVADQCRKDETKKMINAIESTFKKQIAEPVELALNKALPTMWDEVLLAFRSRLDKAESMYMLKAKSFNCTEDENAEALAALRKRAWTVLRKKIAEQTEDRAFVTKLRAHFEERFRYDAAGTPRVWKPEDDIDGAFKKAKDETLELVPLYAKIQPVDSSLEFSLPDDASDDFDFEETLEVFSETKSLELISKFRKEADAYFVEAKRSTVLSVSQIPYWIYVMMAVLGWNEALMILFNPLYFTMLLIGLVSAYIILQLGLAGPLLQIVRTLVGEVQRQGAAQLRAHFSEQALANNPQVQSSDDDTREELRRRQE